MAATQAAIQNLINADLVAAAPLAVLLGVTEYAGDPTNALTPTHINQFCRDTSGNHLYWASTTASSGWKKLNN